MTTAMLPQFVATTWLLAMLPGVGQALMLRQTLTDGPRAAVATICGTATGLVIWSAAAGAGLSAVLLADDTVYRGLLLAGGSVLVAIGARTLWSARHPLVSGDTADMLPEVDAPGPSGRAAYLAGLATNLGNPKAGVFAISLLPAFAGVGFLPTVGFGIVWAAVTACWYLLFVLLVAGGRTFMTRPGAQRSLTAMSGFVLIVVGFAVAAGL